MRINRIPNLIVSCFLLLVLTQVLGCAYATHRVNLTYPPKRGAAEMPSLLIADNPRSMSHGNVELEIFDARTEKDRVGIARTGYGAKGSDFVTEDNVATWVEDAFAYHLTEAGYSILMKGSGSINDADAGLTVDIQKVFGVAFGTYKADVLLQVTLNRKDHELLIKQYEGTGNPGLNWAYSSKSLAQSLALALQDAISKFFADFALIEPP